IPIAGCLDALALTLNPLIDDAARAMLKPVVEEWTAEVNLIVVNELDFVEKLEDGSLENTDPSDQGAMRPMQTLNVHLSDAGPLSARYAANHLPAPAIKLGVDISQEYVQAMYNDLNNAPSPPGAIGETDQARRQRNAGVVSRFFQSLSSRD